MQTSSFFFFLTGLKIPVVFLVSFPVLLLLKKRGGDKRNSPFFKTDILFIEMTSLILFANFVLQQAHYAALAKKQKTKQ